MKVFDCDACGALVFFESVKCVRCEAALGFLPEIRDLSALQAVDGYWQALASAAVGRSYRLCQNGEQHQVCNWMVGIDDPDPFCVACRLNDMIPDLDVGDNRDRWRKLETAKRRLIYTLLSLKLSWSGVSAENRPPLRFRFMGNTGGSAPWLTGHDQGVITINVAEADDVERERRRVQFHEPYRTLPGHLRHEIAHYYWDQLISFTPRLWRFRELFGNEELDYKAALEKYYQQVPPADWQINYISAYASSHPWEDWAETWAHYLHVIDTMETAVAYGMVLNPKHPAAKTMVADPTEIAGKDASFDEILKHWVPLVCALNSFNRDMGLPDLYPFVLSPAVIEKLRFIHEVVRRPRA